MKYVKEERLEIGRRIYEGELNRFEASVVYGIGVDTARDYMRLYRAVNNLPPMNYAEAVTKNMQETDKMQLQNVEELLKNYENMTRSELIVELLKANSKE